MRQHHQVDAGRGKRQCPRLAAQRQVLRKTGVAAHPPRHPIVAQEVEAGQPNLHRVEAEDVGHNVIHTGAFPFEQIAASRTFQPQPGLGH